MSRFRKKGGKEKEKMKNQADTDASKICSAGFQRGPTCTCYSPTTAYGRTSRVQTTTCRTGGKCG